MSKETGQERYDRISELLATMHPKNQINQIILECAREIWELAEEAIIDGAPVIQPTLLMGAGSWFDYVNDGNGLISNWEILERLRLPHNDAYLHGLSSRYASYLHHAARLICRLA